MTLVKSVVVFVLAIFVVSCAAYDEKYETTSVLDNRTGTVSKDASFLVSVEADGKYMDKPYPGSGDMARMAMVNALSKYAFDVSEIPGFVSEEAATVDARDRDVAYLVYLRLLHWEDRVTEWSGKPDRIEVEIRLIDGRSSEVLESQIVKANSKWATFGGDHPQDLLAKPFELYAASLFGAEIKGSEAS
jgi:hypothetical protein